MGQFHRLLPFMHTEARATGNRKGRSLAKNALTVKGHGPVQQAIVCPFSFTQRLVGYTYYVSLLV